MPGSRQLRRDEVHAFAVRIAHLQRQSPQQIGGIKSNAMHDGQGLAISAEHDVLTVVDRLAFELDPPRAPAEGARRLEQRDLVTALGQPDRGCTASPAGTDYRDTFLPRGIDLGDGVSH